jgi:hypothetical protein
MAFYAQRDDTSFEEAASVTPVTINGHEGYFLADVAGGITVDATVLTFDDRIVDFELAREEHQAIYDVILQSFEFTGGS